MYKTIKIILIVVSALFFTSCLEDEGNELYTDINEVEISGIEEDYEFLRFDFFNIIPQLNFTQDTNQDGYTYIWEAIKLGGEDSGESFLLSEDRDLTNQVTLKTGEYSAYYKVKDLITGVEFQQNFNITVITEISEGWLVLSEVSGGSRLDMVSYFNQTFTSFYDVLAFSDLNLEGTPDFVQVIPPPFSGDPKIYLTTSGTRTTKIDPLDFSWSPDFDLANEFAPAFDVSAQLISKASINNIIIADNKLYISSVFTQTPFDGTTHIPGSTNLAPALIPSFFSIFFDTETKQFLSLQPSNTLSPLADPPGSLFSFNTGKDLVHLAATKYNSPFGLDPDVGFAVLKDPSDSKNYLAIFKAGFFPTQIHYGEIANAPDFNNATHFAVNSDFGYLFYSVGSKLYQYDFTSGNTNLMFDNGDEITLLKFQYFQFSNLYQNKLIVGSYDGTEGTMDFYTVPPLNADLELFESYNGFGKIKSIDYKK